MTSKRNRFSICAVLLLAVLASVFMPGATAESTHITKDYTDLGITIDAECPAPEGGEVPVLTASVSQSYFEEIAQAFLVARYPEAEKSENGWSVEAEDELYGTYLKAYAHLEGSSFQFCDGPLDVNGGQLDPDTASGKYGYFTDITLKRANGEDFPLDEAIAEAIQAVENYTDFDLTACNAVAATGNLKSAYDFAEKSCYRVQLSLSCQGIPLHTYSDLTSNTGADVTVTGEGIGWISGSFLLEQIEEGETRQVRSLDEILDVFDAQAEQLVPAGVKESWEIYRIQLEYYAEATDTDGEYNFRPVWTFYGTVDGAYTGNVMLYADTGEVCTGRGSV